MEIEYWHWIALGLGLMVLEILTPGFYILWIGLAAVMTGLVNLAVPGLSFIEAGTVFVVLSLGISFLGRRLYKRRSSGTWEKKTLNRRAEQYIGRTFVVSEAIVNGMGKVRVGDTLWPVRADRDAPVGASVRIESVDGIHLVGKIV